jgi:hypothetical protein
MEQEEASFEKARRLVRIAATAARDAALALGDGDPAVPPITVVNQAVVGAARRHLPGVDVTILERAAGGRGGARPFPARPYLARQGLGGQGPGGQWHRQRDKIVLTGA